MYDYLAKVILLGPSGCGKSVAHCSPSLPRASKAPADRASRSCLLHRFVKNECTPAPLPVPALSAAFKIHR